MAADGKLGFYEERLAGLVMALALVPEAWHEDLAQEFETVGRIPLERWEFLMRIAILYAAGLGGINFLSMEDAGKYEEDLSEILDTVFPNPKKANAQYLRLHDRFLKMERKRQTGEPAHVEIICVLLGQWVLGEALHWTRIKPEDAPAVARVGRDIVEEFLYWFDRDFEPSLAIDVEQVPGAGQ